MKRNLKVQLADNGIIVKDKEIDEITVVEYVDYEKSGVIPEQQTPITQLLGKKVFQDIWATFEVNETEVLEVEIKIKPICK